MNNDNKQNRLKAPLHVYRKKLEDMEEILSDMSLLTQDAVFIVEGKRDVQALISLGMHARFEIATQRPLPYLCDDIALLKRPVVILTDWDRRGNILMLKIKKYLQSLDVNPDTELRERIASIVRKDIKDVESLPTYMSKLRQITGANTMDGDVL